ncbi:MAG: ABC transporter substrate-binding protein [Burkholderiales bacterium]|nr:ABC transporter substrate-binding protein [Burkholderiales bacterium]
MIRAYRICLGRFARSLLLALAGTAMATAAMADIELIGVTEASGGGAAAGTSFKNGYLMAIDEINATGGVLGQKLVLKQIDIETHADAAKAAVGKAVEAKPFAILGPVFSGLTAASSPLTAPGKIPQFTGGEAASLTRNFHPSLLRTSLSQLGSAPRMGALITYGLNTKKVGLIWIENEFGKDGRAALLDAIKRRGGTVVFDQAMKPGQKNPIEIAEGLKKSDAEALMLYVNENEAVEMLKALKEAGFTKPIVSDGLVAAQKVLDGAGPAAEGVYAHMNASIAAPSSAVQSFVARYQARYAAKPDQNSMKGFIAINVLKAGIEMGGKVDQELFLKTIKDKRLESKTYPDLLTNINYDFFGDINRESFYVLIRGGAPHIVASIPGAEGGAVRLTDGRLITLNSTEFRSALREPVNLALNKLPAKK